MGFPVAQSVNNLPAVQETCVRSLSWEDPLEKEMAAHSSILAGKNPMDCSPPGSSLHEIFQARIVEWVAISFSRASSQPRDQTRVSCTAGRLFTYWATREALGFQTSVQVLMTRVGTEAKELSWTLCVGKMAMAEGPALSQMSWDLLGLAWELSVSTSLGCCHQSYGSIPCC